MYPNTQPSTTPLLPELAKSHWTQRAMMLDKLEKELESKLVLWLTAEFEDQTKISNYLSRFRQTPEWDDQNLMSQEAEIITSFLLSVITGLQIPMEGKFNKLRHEVRKFILNSAIRNQNP